MPRKKLTLIPGRENSVVDCFAFRVNKGGRPECAALTDIYCLKEDKPCPFRRAASDAAAARERAHRRLIRLGYR